MKQLFSSLKQADWPEHDRTLWLKAQQPPGPFETLCPAAHWRPATVNTVEKYYGTFLWWLKTSNLLDADARPIDRASRIHIAAFHAAFATGRAEHTIATAIRGIASMVRATAPPDGLPWLTKLANRLVNTGVASKAKLPRLVPVVDLVALGKDLMEANHAKLNAGSRRAAVNFRDGLIIAALAMRPLRLRNFVELQLGTSFWRDTSGVHVRFAPKDTKGGQGIDFIYPNSLASAFDTYLSTARPLLLRTVKDDGGQALWISRLGNPMDGIGIYNRISLLTKRHFGIGLSPHLFRDCAVTDIAVLDPVHIGIAKSVLGHATLATSQKYYNQATMLTAGRRFQASLEMTRVKSPKLANPKARTAHCA